MTVIRPENTRTIWEPYADVFPFSKKPLPQPGKKLLTYAFPVDREAFVTGNWFEPAICDRIMIMPATQARLTESFEIGIYIQKKLVTSSVVSGSWGYKEQFLQFLLEEPIELYPAMEVVLGFYNGGIDLMTYAASATEEKISGEKFAREYEEATANGGTNIPAQIPTMAKITAEGPPVVIFRGPTPLKPKKPLLREVQKQMPVLKRQYPMSTPAANLVQFGGIRAYDTAKSIGAPLAQRPGLNVDDVFWSCMGRVVGGVRGYWQSNYKSEMIIGPEGPGPIALNHYIYSGNIFGLTVEAITKAEANGAAFWLYSSPQMRVVVKGTTIEFSLFFTGGTKKLTAANALTGVMPQLVQCIYNPTTGKMAVWVDGVEKANQAAVGTLVSELKITTTGTLATSTTITAISANALTFGVGWPIEGIGIPALTSISEILSSTSVKISNAATESKSGSSITTYQPEILLMPEGTTTTEAWGQDIAIYEMAMSKARIEEHLAAFRQILTDPSHVLV